MFTLTRSSLEAELFFFFTAPMALDVSVADEFEGLKEVASDRTLKVETGLLLGSEQLQGRTDAERKEFLQLLLQERARRGIPQAA